MPVLDYDIAIAPASNLARVSGDRGSWRDGVYHPETPRFCIDCEARRVFRLKGETRAETCEDTRACDE
jgi:hypothetical protein